MKGAGFAEDLLGHVAGLLRGLGAAVIHGLTDHGGTVGLANDVDGVGRLAWW